MTTYSVADAKNGLPKLIDRVLEGEEVTIVRHGKAVAELRAGASKVKTAAITNYGRLRDPRLSRKKPGLTSVERLNQL